MKTQLKLKILNVDNQGYHIFVKAKMNGKSANLLLDTGASKTVFDANRIGKFAEQSSMKVNDHKSTGLGTNSMQSHTIVIKKLSLGELQIKNYELFLLDLSHVNETYEKLNYKALDGVIGGDILMQYKAQINYKNKTLKLFF